MAINETSRLTVPPIRPDGLQLQEHRARQRRYWRIQRVAWWGFAAIMLAAVLGLTGNGGLFHKQTIRFAHATVEIPRVSRWDGSDAMTITFAASSDRPQITITQPFFDRFSVERIQPEAAQTLLTQGAQSMTFAATGPAPYRVTVDLRAASFGWTRFAVTVAGETRAVDLIVLP